MDNKREFVVYTPEMRREDSRKATRISLIFTVIIGLALVLLYFL